MPRVATVTGTKTVRDSQLYIHCVIHLYKTSLYDQTKRTNEPEKKPNKPHKSARFMYQYALFIKNSAASAVTAHQLSVCYQIQPSVRQIWTVKARDVRISQAHLLDHL